MRHCAQYSVARIVDETLGLNYPVILHLVTAATRRIHHHNISSVFVPPMRSTNHGCCSFAGDPYCILKYIVSSPVGLLLKGLQPKGTAPHEKTPVAPSSKRFSRRKRDTRSSCESCHFLLRVKVMDFPTERLPDQRCSCLRFVGHIDVTRL